MSTRILVVIFFALLWPGAVSRAQFFSGPPKAAPSLVSNASAIEPGKAFTVGIRFEMAEGWHLYWQFPGDSGAAPQVEWQLPAGFSAKPIQWPLPHLLKAEGDLFTNVYEKEVLLPVEIQPPAQLPGASVSLKAKLKWYVCKETCLPGEEEVSLELPVGQTAPANSELFALWQSRLPQSDTPPFQTSWNRKADAWLVSIRGSTDAGQLELFPIPPAGQNADHAESQPASGDAKVFRIAAPEAAIKTPGWRALVVLNKPDGSRQGWEVGETATEVLSTQPEASPNGPVPEGGLAGVLWAAFLGGVLLNLMPCVLPVIALKILGFTQQAGQDPKRVFRLGLSFCAGVFAFFLGLAAAVIALAKAGSSLNWGFQFQNPWILTGLISAVFVFGLNLLGVFEITLSSDASAKLSELSGKQGHWGAFMHGAFTTLLGTSCTAPYLGVTLGFAMSQPAPVVVAIFVTIAAGMSLPYLVLTSNPTLLRFLPKPGMWMERLKQGMGFVMLAVAVWLLSVLGEARGAEAMAGASALLLTLGVGCWLLGILRNRALGLVLALVLALGGWQFFVRQPLSSAPASAHAMDTSGDDWTPFSPEQLAAERAAGRPVFVDFTATWCLNCKVNERVALAKPQVVEAFKKHGVVRMKADWTTNDPVITAELKKFGRVSVPFYLLYVPGSAEPQILPTVLTPSLMLETLQALPIPASKESPKAPR